MIDRGLTPAGRHRLRPGPTRIKPTADAAPTVCLLAWQTAEEVTVVIVIIAAIEAWVRRRRAKRLATASRLTDA